MIKVQNLSKVIKKQVIFSDMNFEFEKGIYLLQGDNGVGKSTFLKVLAGLYKPTNGNILWDPPYKKTEAGFISDTPLFIEELSFSDNMRFIANLRGISKANAEEKIKLYSELFNLPIGTRKVLYEYSSGMRRKVELAISLINDPICLIWDEPFKALDKKSINILFEEIISEDKLFIISTHNVELLKFYNTHIIQFKR